MLYDDDDLLAYSALYGPIRRRKRITKTRLLRKDDSLHMPAISTDSVQQSGDSTVGKPARHRRDQSLRTVHES